MRVAQVTFFPPAELDDLRQVIEAWRLVEIPAALAQVGCKVSVLVSIPAPLVHSEQGVSVEFVPEASWARRTSTAHLPPARLVARVRQLDPDVLHVHGFGHPWQLMYLRSQLRRRPIIVQDHANKAPTSRRHALILRAAMRSAHTVTFTDVALAEPFIDAGILGPRTRVRRVMEGSTLFAPGDQPQARKKTGLHGAPCCLWAGDLNRNKDPLTALEGFRLALADLPRAQLWMCFRQAPIRSEVDAYLAAYPTLAEHVHLLGGRPHADMEYLHRAADFYVSASHQEGGAYSMVEALACGSVPIVTDAPVFQRFTARGAFGGVFQRGDAVGLRDILVAWTARLSPALRVRQRQHFDAELSNASIAQALAAVYREALA